MLQPMTDLILLLSKLVDNKGKILIPGVNELVAPLTDEEKSVLSQFRHLDQSLTLALPLEPVMRTLIMVSTMSNQPRADR